MRTHWQTVLDPARHRPTDQARRVRSRSPHAAHQAHLASHPRLHQRSGGARHCQNPEQGLRLAGHLRQLVWHWLID